MRISAQGRAPTLESDMKEKTPKSTNERQYAYRARQAENGKAEVRGIFATQASAAKIRRYAAKLK